MHSTTRTNNTDENGGGDNGRDKKKSKRSARGSSNSNSGGGGGGRSSKRHQVMSASNQTDEERRELRDNQRALKRDILHSEVGESIEDPTSEAFVDIRGKNNALFNQVRYIREGVLDGENLTLISTRAARQVDKLIQVPRYDAAKFAIKLKAKCISTGGSSNFDWYFLGKEAGLCVDSIPSGVSFLRGAIDAEYKPKERKQRARRKNNADDEDVQEERPEVVKQMEKGADKLSAVEKHMRVMYKTLKRRCREEGDIQLAKLSSMEESELSDAHKRKKRIIEETKQSEICAVQYFCNPKSFTQTVENIYHFSFLLKQGQAGIRVKKDSEDGIVGSNGGRPVVCVTEENDTANVEPRQSILSFTMKDWKALVNGFGVEESDVPHRTGTKFDASNA